MQDRVGLINAYKVAHRSLRVELLKLILETYPSLTLSELAQALNVTRRQYEKARDALCDVEGVTKVRQKFKKKRAWSRPEQLEYFVNFLMRPENLQQVAYGSHKYKMDFGNDFEVPNWMRKKVRFALGRQFLQ